MRILITGSAGFIGFHLSQLFLKNNHDVIGIDNMCQSYGVEYKVKRLNILKKNRKFKLYKIDVGNIFKLKEKKIDYIVHLAAQAGVRLSQENPDLFIKDNILGTVKIFEFAKKNKIKNIFYASSSSVYGNESTPFNEKQYIKNPVSFYSTTKITNELFAENYSKLYNFKTTC